MPLAPAGSAGKTLHHSDMVNATSVVTVNNVIVSFFITTKGSLCFAKQIIITQNPPRSCVKFLTKIIDYMDCVGTTLVLVLFSLNAFFVTAQP